MTSEGGGRTDWRSRIEINLDNLTEKPVIKGTRLAVEFIIDLLAQGWPEAASGSLISLSITGNPLIFLRAWPVSYLEYRRSIL